MGLILLGDGILTVGAKSGSCIATARCADAHSHGSYWRIGSLAPAKLHGSAGSKNADGEQRYHLSQANGAADLECSRQQLGVEPRRASPRCQRESRALRGTALRPERVAKGENRDQQENSA